MSIISTLFNLQNPYKDNKINNNIFLASFMLMFCAPQQEEEVTEVIYEGPETELATAVVHPTEGNSPELFTNFSKINLSVYKTVFSNYSCC